MTSLPSLTVMRKLSKTWRPVPLPMAFRHELDSNRWAEALSIYTSHPYHAPVMDTYELLRSILLHTSLGVDVIKNRLENRMRSALANKRRPPEEIEWNVFWEALNNGDSRVISMSLSGARVQGVASQTAVAEACAALLHSHRSNWYTQLVDSVPYATVTASNLMTIALHRRRWDLALEMLPHVKLNRSDALSMWPSVSKLGWQTSLSFFILGCKGFALDLVDEILDSGCEVTILAEQLERAKLLNDKRLVSKLIQHVCENFHRSSNSGDFVNRCFEHLHDLGCITSATLKLVKELLETKGPAKVLKLMKDKEIAPHNLTVEALEDIRSR